jgi:hypothetical protein
MGQARTTAIRGYIKRHGLKLCYVANGMGMDEALLRYHLRTGFDNPELVERFKALMRAHARGVIEDLGEVQPPIPSP